MSLFMLDTNIASHLIRGDIPSIRDRVASVPIGGIVISAITEAELAYGVKKLNDPAGLSARVYAFLARVDVLPWNSDAAKVYATLRVAGEAKGITLGSMDMMIAAHAASVEAVLVTRDKAFSLMPNLDVVDWSK